MDKRPSQSHEDRRSERNPLVALVPWLGMAVPFALVSRLSPHVAGAPTALQIFTAPYPGLFLVCLIVVLAAASAAVCVVLAAIGWFSLRRCNRAPIPSPESSFSQSQGSNPGARHTLRDIWTANRARCQFWGLSRPKTTLFSNFTFLLLAKPQDFAGSHRPRRHAGPQREKVAGPRPGLLSKGADISTL